MGSSGDLHEQKNIRPLLFFLLDRNNFVTPLTTMSRTIVGSLDLLVLHILPLLQFKISKICMLKWRKKYLLE